MVTKARMMNRVRGLIVAQILVPVTEKAARVIVRARILKLAQAIATMRIPRMAQTMAMPRIKRKM